MRSVIVFTPQASPTYVPLGPAVLAGLARRECPEAGLGLLDLNIFLWEKVLAEEEGGGECLAFMRGHRGDFFNEEEYGEAAQPYRAAELTITKLSVEAKKHLKGEVVSGRFLELLEELSERVLAGNPSFVGFSFFSLGQLPWILCLARTLREKEAGRGLRLVVGGASTTAVDWEELLRAAPFLDALALGEGEEALLGLLKGQPLAEIPGLAFLLDGEPVRTERPPAWEVGRSADPDFSTLPLKSYLVPKLVLPVLASRGCKWGRCRFCAHNSTYLGGFRPLSGSIVAGQLARLKEAYGCSHFYFADLYLDAPELAELSRALTEADAQVFFHVLGRPTAEHTAELFSLARRAGLRWISWGVESGSDELLQVAGKGTRAAEVERVLLSAKEAGISNLAMMIFGLPTSTAPKMEETFAFLERVYPHIDAMTASPFALFDNSPFGKNPARFGLRPGERQLELTVGGRPVHSFRRDFFEENEAGEERPPRGQVEAASWWKRRRWLGEAPFLEALPCEHYLLYVSKE